MEETELYVKAVSKWGHALQINQAIQEMAELTKELTKIFQEKTDFNKIIEEMADVSIMLEQLKVIMRNNKSLDFDTKFADWRYVKLRRLEGWLNQKIL